MKRSQQDLEERLRESVAFLKASAQAFDAGFEAEAKRMAVTVRVLLHHTDSSHSLLSQLERIESIQWIDSAEGINPNNLLNLSLGLVVVRVTPAGSQYVAPLDNRPPGMIKPAAAFDDWWNNDVLRDKDGQTWSRRRMVLHLANREGGAHVDPRLNEQYSKIVDGNGLGIFHVGESGEAPVGGNIISASVRQITHEVLKTLN